MTSLSNMLVPTKLEVKLGDKYYECVCLGKRYPGKYSGAPKWTWMQDIFVPSTNQNLTVTGHRIREKKG